MEDETIKKDLVKAYWDDNELVELALDVVNRNSDCYKHLLLAYDIPVEQLEAILAEMGYIGS